MTHPLWLRLCALIAAIWYGFGLFQFHGALTLDVPAALAAGAITPGYAALHGTIPGAVWAAYALASLAGLAGAGLLLTGRRAAPAFALSLLSALAYWTWLFGRGGAALPREEPAIAATVLAVTAGLLLLARSRRRGLRAA